MLKEMRIATYRMSQYAFILNAEREEVSGGDRGRTIDELSGLMGMPLSTVRADIASMMRKGMVIPAIEEHEEMYSPSRIIAGAADHIVFAGFSRNNFYTLPLSNVEYQAYRMFDRTDDVDAASVLLIKDSFRSAGYEGLLKQLEKITSAIEQKKNVQIQYYDSKDRLTGIQIRPLKIVHNAMDNTYAIATIDQTGELRLYALERIVNISIKNGVSKDPELSRLAILDHLWGLDTVDGPYHVRIKFYDEADVHNKVRRDTANYQYAKLTLKNGYLYFEDDVYGYEAFRSWVYSYGASAIVEEPEKLRNDIIEVMRKRTS